MRLISPWCRRCRGRVIACEVFNNGLAVMLDGVQAGLPRVSFAGRDMFRDLGQVANSAAAGLPDVQNTCITPDTNIHLFCAQPDQYLFWDGIHPTCAGHAILVRCAQTALGP